MGERTINYKTLCERRITQTGVFREEDRVTKHYLCLYVLRREANIFACGKSA